jgi:sensor c-di-GMP phosphodiesterase-like protein
MIIHLLDIAPMPSSFYRRIERESEKEVKKAEKETKKAVKQMKKATKQAEKEAKKAEKQAKKAEKQFKDFSAAPAKTITTIQERTGTNSEMQYAAMPTGLVLSICASLLICLASAWYYRRRSSKA